MRLNIFHFFILLVVISLISCERTARRSRRKRYVAFPEGATLSAAVCMTTQLIRRPPQQVFTEGLNWGISYDLPNNTAILHDFKNPEGFLGRRRRRRALYNKLENIMDAMGYNGRDCVYKALCETGALFNERGEGLIQEILRIIFSFPTQKILSHEPNDHKFYRDAHISGKESLDPDECAVRYSKCTFSLIDLALGYYTDNIPSLL